MTAHHKRERGRRFRQAQSRAPQSTQRGVVLLLPPLSGRRKCRSRWAYFGGFGGGHFGWGGSGSQMSKCPRCALPSLHHATGSAAPECCRACVCGGQVGARLGVWACGSLFGWTVCGAPGPEAVSTEQKFLGQKGRVSPPSVGPQPPPLCPLFGAEHGDDHRTGRIFFFKSFLDLSGVLAGPGGMPAPRPPGDSGVVDRRGERTRRPPTPRHRRGARGEGCAARRRGCPWAVPCRGAGGRVASWAPPGGGARDARDDDGGAGAGRAFPCHSCSHVPVPRGCSCVWHRRAWAWAHTSVCAHAL